MSDEELRVAIQATREKWIEIQNTLIDLQLKAVQVCALCRWASNKYATWENVCRKCPVKPACGSERSLLTKWVNASARLETRTTEIINYLNKLEEEVP